VGRAQGAQEDAAIIGPVLRAGKLSHEEGRVVKQICSNISHISKSVRGGHNIESGRTRDIRNKKMAIKVGIGLIWSPGKRIGKQWDSGQKTMGIARRHGHI
jgi:hypothetical protein